MVAKLPRLGHGTEEVDLMNGRIVRDDLENSGNRIVTDFFSQGFPCGLVLNSPLFKVIPALLKVDRHGLGLVHSYRAVVTPDINLR